MQRSFFSTTAHRQIRGLGTLLLAFVFMLSLSACDSTDSNSDDNGDTPPETVSMSIAGDDIEMNAFFATGTDPETGEDAFIIYLTEANDLSGGGSFQTGNSFGYIARLSAQPGTGTYSFSEVNFEDGVSDDVLRDQFIFVFFEGFGTQNGRWLMLGRRCNRASLAFVGTPS